MAAALRATYVVLQIGSKLARSACGTKRSVRAAARWEIAGVASPPVAIAPAAVFRNDLRCRAAFQKLPPVGTWMAPSSGRGLAERTVRVRRPLGGPGRTG